MAKKPVNIFFYINRKRQMVQFQNKNPVYQNIPSFAYENGTNNHMTLFC